MLREITLGQYYQTDSVIHRLDPRTKILGIFVYLVSLFFFTNPINYMISFFMLVLMIGLSKVPFSFIVRGMKPVLMIMLLTVVFNMFLTKGEPLLTIGRFTMTREGLINAIYMALRLTFLVLGSSIMTLTTTPNQLTDGLESVFRPLKIFKVPVHEMAMMMSIALRFIPILTEETDKIMKAQLARGADFESGNLVKRAKSFLPVIVPLFVSAFRRAGDLAMAMEARCYQGGEGRTKMKPLQYHSRDFGAYVVLTIYVALLFLAGLWIVKIIPLPL